VRATWTVVVVEAILGIPSMLSLDYLGISDLIWGSTGQPLGSMLAVLAVGWFLDRARALESAGLGSRGLGRLWLFWIRWVVPGCVLIALVSGWLDG
jgi:SNF family Na+-dependent transporter